MTRLYRRPDTIDEAIAAMSAPQALAVCGGTDVFPAHVGRPVTRPVVDLSAVRGLRGIEFTGDAIRIGAATTWTDIVASKLPAACEALKLAAREVGSIQIQNRGTIGGNLCNASPAADGVPPLLALDASVETVCPQGKRVMPLSAFITGYRKTVLAPGEIVSAVVIPDPKPAARSSFVKLGARKYLVISILMAAAVIEDDGDGRISRAAVAVGAASAVAQRLPALEAALTGRNVESDFAALITPEHLAPLSPIDDVRATAGYRRDAAREIVAEALRRAAGASGLV